MITVAELIGQLSDMPADALVFTIHGASGVSCEVSSPFLRVRGDVEAEGADPQGDVLELSDGTEYVSIYIGN